MRWCWINFQCRGVLLIWIKVGQGPTALAVGAGRVVWTFFSLIYLFSFLSPSLWETARYRLKYCLEGLLSPKQPTNQLSILMFTDLHHLSYTILLHPKLVYEMWTSRSMWLSATNICYFLFSTLGENTFQKRVLSYRKEFAPGGTNSFI